jgi:DNA-binding response OmpR family regulator
MSVTRYNVLHIEDDINDVLLVQRAFRKASLPVALEAVNDGDKALAYLSGEDVYTDRLRYPIPSLVLLDLKIPRKSGLEVLTWIRSHPSWKRLPVTVLTSSRHEKDINLAYEIGANSYLVKPVGFDALVEMVRMINTYWLELNEMPAI